MKKMLCLILSMSIFTSASFSQENGSIFEDESLSIDNTLIFTDGNIDEDDASIFENDNENGQSPDLTGVLKHWLEEESQNVSETIISNTNKHSELCSKTKPAPHIDLYLNVVEKDPYVPSSCKDIRLKYRWGSSEMLQANNRCDYDQKKYESRRAEIRRRAIKTEKKKREREIAKWNLACGENQGVHIKKENAELRERLRKLDNEIRVEEQTNALAAKKFQAEIQRKKNIEALNDQRNKIFEEQELKRKQIIIKDEIATQTEAREKSDNDRKIWCVSMWENQKKRFCGCAKYLPKPIKTLGVSNTCIK